MSIHQSSFHLIVEMMQAYADREAKRTESERITIITETLRQRYDVDLGDDPSDWAQWAIDRDVALSNIERSNLKFIKRIFDIRKKFEWLD